MPMRKEEMSRLIEIFWKYCNFCLKKYFILLNTSLVSDLQMGRIA